MNWWGYKVLELRNSKRTYLGKTADGKDKWALDCYQYPVQMRLSPYHLWTPILPRLLTLLTARNMASPIDVQVGAGADDGWWKSDESEFDNDDTTVYAGDTRRDFSRFTGISGLAGATIGANTTIQWLTAAGYNGKAYLLKIYAEDAEAPVAVANAADGNAKTKTTAAVDWDFTSSDWNTSPSIASIIQELATSYNPSAIQIIIWDDGGLVHSFMRTYEDNPASGMKLHIEYTTGPAGWSHTLSGILTPSTIAGAAAYTTVKGVA